MSRWRVQLRITGELRWLSHLDILSMVERGLKRARLPAAYSEGYNPHMLISWGPAHPVGLAGEAEYFDLEFKSEPEDNWYQAVNLLLPQGLEIAAARPLKEKTQALMASINRAAYRVSLAKITEAEIDEGIKKLLAAQALSVLRHSPKGDKTADIRPGIIELRREGLDLVLVSTLGSASSAKPQEVALLAAPGAEVEYMSRTGMFIESNGVIQKP